MPLHSTLAAADTDDGDNPANLFQALSSNVPGMGVLVVDRATVIRRATGVIPGLVVTTDPEQLIGRVLTDLVLPDYRSDWQRYVGAALRGESYFFADHWASWRCECYVGPVRDDSGQIGRVLIVFRDVTEQYRQDQALQQMNRALQESNQHLEQFAYVASHDLQEPLRKIRLFSSLVAERAVDRLDDADRDLLLRVQSAARRMYDLTESLLTFAQLNARPPAVDLVDLTDLFSTLLADLEVTILERSAIIELVPPLIAVPGDAQQLRRLFLNLLTNALKFTAPGVAPRVSVQSRLVVAREVTDLANPSNEEFAEISVRDNGIGIPADQTNQIFRMFGRLNTRAQYAGTGIGLATVRQIVEYHRGALTVDSREGEGTTFRVYLPLNTTAEPTDETSA